MAYRSTILIFLLLMDFPIFPQKAVTIFTKTNQEGNIDFYANNSEVIPCYVIIRFKELVNFTPSFKLPYGTVLPACVEGCYLFSLTKNNTNCNYDYSYKYFLGDPISVKHDDSYVYLLPYEHGTKHQVTQGYNGEHTHKGEYALDFDLDVGTTVMAARSGIVVYVKKDSDIADYFEPYWEHTNTVLVYHSDGTFGSYRHFKKDGVVVRYGDRIQAGQLIGYSGNTGISSGPHLHFDVRYPTREGNRVSIPTLFLNYNGKAIGLQEGLYYYATNPGKPTYKAVLGREIVDEDYANYRAKAAKTDTVNIRIEQIDNTLLVFALNGFDRKLKITIDFKLINLHSSKPVPYTNVMPPLSERYLFILRPKKIKDEWEYTYRYSYQFVLP